MIDKETYERDLQRRQRKHLADLARDDNWQPCLHDQCPKCLGTGLSKDGVCIHMISCPCPKCTCR